MRHRVVSVSPRRSTERLIRLVSTALDEAGLTLTPDERKALWRELIKQVDEEGLTLTWQV